MKFRPPFKFDQPQLAGREEALVKLGITAPSMPKMGKLFPNLAEIRIQRQRWQRTQTAGTGESMNSVARQGGVSKQQLYNMMENFGG